jgi:hypothetical protein
MAYGDAQTNFRAVDMFGATKAVVAEVKPTPTPALAPEPVVEEAETPAPEAKKTPASKSKKTEVAE